MLIAKVFGRSLEGIFSQPWHVLEIKETKLAIIFQIQIFFTFEWIE